MSFIRFSCSLLLALSLASLITGCSTPRLFINSDLPVIADDAKFIVLPTDIHGLSGSRPEKETIFYASFNTAFAEQAIHLSQLASRLKQHDFADVSWEMSHAMHRLVTEHDCFSYTDAYQLALNKGKTSSKFRALDNDLYHLSQWLQQEYHLSAVPEYIAVAHIDSMGVSQAGELIKYRVIAGIYSTQRQALERVVTYVTESPNQRTAILHDLDNLGFLIYRELFKLN
ncbi:RNA polymerase subunit sigma [Moritella sp.]|uniref:RNA polymerase subunit sigma n=1 Tax=Moritella sp. TaxID=78556 RepID=UPI001E10596E|nr:RNA polymerase subunit sigma [Moritella sp.]MCJ8350200.1 RNA polymerase subunit sigma [Moritella sp.]NQZ40859.1 RNA polymerase subunit sigma [Moritella sp.]